MSLLSGVALRQFQRKYFGSLKSMGYRRPANPSRPAPARPDPAQYDRWLAEEDAARRQRFRKSGRQIRLFILMLTLLPILAFILACLR